MPFSLLFLQTVLSGTKAFATDLNRFIPPSIYPPTTCTSVDLSYKTFTLPTLAVLTAWTTAVPESCLKSSNCCQILLPRGGRGSINSWHANNILSSERFDCFWRNFGECDWVSCDWSITVPKFDQQIFNFSLETLYQYHDFHQLPPSCARSYSSSCLPLFLCQEHLKLASVIQQVGTIDTTQPSLWQCRPTPTVETGTTYGTTSL